jgi:hypothetical protein
MWATIMAPIPWSVRRTGRSETGETCVGRLITQRRLNALQGHLRAVRAPGNQSTADGASLLTCC